MNNISCEICMDLIPLVQDRAASDDTQKAVTHHADHCPACQALLAQTPAPQQMDDRRVLHSLRQRLATTSLIFIVIGAFLGVGLSNSQAVFYNILIMPAIGALGYAALGKKAALVPVALFAFSYLVPLLQLFMQEDLLEGAATTLLFWAIIYCGLCVLGLIIAALFHFAFRKDGTIHEG